MENIRTIELKISERDFILEFINSVFYIPFGEARLSDNTLNCLKNTQPDKFGMMEFKINQDEIILMLKIFRNVKYIKIEDMQQNTKLQKKASAIVDRLRVIERKLMYERIMEPEIERLEKENNVTNLRSNIRIYASNLGSWIIGN